MKRAGAALLISAAIILAGAGCRDGLSGSEVDGPAAESAPPPPADAAEFDADTPEAASSASDGHGVEDEATGEDLEPEAAGTEILPQSDDRLLEREDLVGLDNWELTLARNEIFARHGRPFENPDIRAHFEGLPWYSPDEDYSDAWLSLIERQNADFILNHQSLSYEIPATHP